jgi:D-alanyl-D-alanine carboxypeptidase (penicillin-binding protein 5/6)
MTKNKRKINIVLTVIAVVLALLSAVSAVGVWFASNARDKAQLHDPKSVNAIKYSDSMMEIDVDSPQSFVYDVSSDTIIQIKGESGVVYPGSTTKLLTALYALEILDPAEVVTPGNELELVKKGSSVAYINSSHKLTVEMLVEAMIIPSGNDATYVLAAAAGKRLSPDKTIDGKAAVDVFMIGLRAYAEKIGLCGSQILVPDGYEGDGHYTTVEDMIIVSRLATQNEIIMKYAAMPDASVVYASGHTNTWNNTNKLLDESGAFYSPYVTGLKTGTVDGECSLIFSFEFEDGRKYIAGLFGSPDKNTRFYDALKIIEELK